MPDVSPTPAAKPPAVARPPNPVHQEGSVKETIESILVAFILAFVFRAFVVEAFVIPTGSMAPTLMGAHMRFHCKDCGYRWDVNYSTGRSGDDINIPANYYRSDELTRTGGEHDVAVPLHCPNCGWPVQQFDKDDPDDDLHDVPVHYGDRILVLKYLYKFENPRRWDVVVFKAPLLGNPQAAQYSENYIKRLVGNPGESIIIMDGDVYVGQRGVSPYEHPDAFHIARKPWVVQQALWRNVYDNDYIPHLPASQREPQWIDDIQTGHVRTDSTGKPVPAGHPWQQPWVEPGGRDAWGLKKNPRQRTLEMSDASGPPRRAGLRLGRQPGHLRLPRPRSLRRVRRADAQPELAEEHRRRPEARPHLHPPGRRRRLRDGAVQGTRHVHRAPDRWPGDALPLARRRPGRGAGRAGRGRRPGGT